MGAFNLNVSVKQWMKGGDSRCTSVQMIHKEEDIRSQLSPHSEGQDTNNDEPICVGWMPAGEALSLQWPGQARPERHLLWESLPETLPEM